MGLGVIRALGMMGVPIVLFTYDKRDMGQVSKYVQESIEVPHPERSEAEFIDLMLELAPRFGRAPLFPVSDTTLAAVSRNKAVLEQHYIVACTEWDITRLFIEKRHTYALAEKVGVPAPKTLIPHSVEQVEEYAQNIEFPCLVKPSQSHLFYAHFGCKMFEVQNVDEMIAIFKQSDEAGLEVMLQEYIPGEDADGANYNSYYWDGRPLAEFTAKKIRNGPPWFGSTRVAISEWIPEVIEPGRRITEAMGFYGFSCTEFKKDSRDGVYKLLEVNGRHNLSSSLAVRCGMNFPWLEYRHLVEGELPGKSDFEKGIYWIDTFRDVGYTFKHLRQERYSLAYYLRPYLGPRVFAIIDRQDPRPFIQKCQNSLSGATRLFRA
jgi:predicted ATP-grasp superfamily ATP-dependent carboligase